MTSYRAIVEASSRWIDRVAATPARRAAETRLKFKMICAILYRIGAPSAE
jgi:hypothetical protein